MKVVIPTAIRLSRKTGDPVNRKRIRRSMLLMGIRAVYSRLRTSDPGVGHTIYPYLLQV